MGILYVWETHESLTPFVTDKDTVNPNLNSWQLPRVRYVLWNIYQVNNLFNTYYTGNGHQLYGSLIVAVLTLFNSPA